ncbi:Ragulator complex protein LAMTOR5 homolog [Geodia barretti]|uniref:Late endosomal/lysosomal adaptor and MAPK and MTOR activator 5 n=1 Tax=Geodia barretti TaxID=519541 RepID=A0AA35SXB9_GEOBA|nr:Ragulator complex protein LAMTOR5 homolog [Geodia barretti]
MEASLESQMNEIMSQPGVTGVLCADEQGLALSAQGTLTPHSAGLVSVVTEKACQLRHGTEPDEKPVVVMEFDTGNVLIRSHNNSTLAVHKV